MEKMILKTITRNVKSSVERVLLVLMTKVMRANPQMKSEVA